MITLLHGDNIEASRDELTRLKQSHAQMEVRELNGKSIDDAMLVQLTESQSLFGESICLVCENVFSPLGRKVKQAKRIADALGKIGSEHTVICWESKEIGKEIKSLLPQAFTERLFTHPKLLFSFLDGIRPGSSKTLLNQLDVLLEHEPVELLWSMIITRVRQLIQIKGGKTPSKVAPWQAGKLTNQSHMFTMNKLLVMHHELLDTEYSFKTGAHPYTMKQSLQLLLIDL